MKCKPWIRHFSPPKFQCFSSQFALHGLRAPDYRAPEILRKEGKTLKNLGIFLAWREESKEILPQNEGKKIKEMLFQVFGIFEQCSDFGTAYDWTKKWLDGTRWRQHFFTFGHCGALVPSLAANGLIVMGPSGVNSLYPSAEESWEEMTKIEPRNKTLYSPGSDQRPGRPVILVADDWLLTFLEAQQPYFSYRAMLVAIVLQNS